MSARVFTVPFVENGKANVGSDGQPIRTELPDARQPGLYLIIQPTGKKSWAARYRFAGKTRKHTIGPYPAVSLASARDLASKALTLVAQGTDPSIERKHARQAVAQAAAAEKRGQRDLFENVAREFLEKYAKPRAMLKNRPDGWKETGRILGFRPDPTDHNRLLELGGDVVPRWRGRKIQEIKRRDINELLDEIVERGSPIMANRVLAAVRKLFNWCVARGILESSECRVDMPAAERSRDRVLAASEMRAFWNATNQAGWPYAQIAKVLLLTGQRLSEVAEMRWSEIDLAARLWKLPADRVKNGKPHDVPLSDAVMEILRAAPQVVAAQGFVFGDHESAPSGFSRAKARIHNAIDPPIPHWTFHDLRRTFATGMASGGVELHVIERLLNHSSGTFRGVAGVYQRHSFAKEKRQAVEAWASVLIQIVQNKSDNVLTLRAHG